MTHGRKRSTFSLSCDDGQRDRHVIHHRNAVLGFAYVVGS